MFERRLRLFLVILFLGGLLLAARAAQVQVIDGDDWLSLASASAEKVSYLNAPRGALLDFRGRVIARDVPTFEACVNYRAIPATPNPKWHRQEALRRARKLPDYTAADDAAREALIAQEMEGVLNDLQEMWTLLAELSGRSPQEIRATRDEIEREVNAKRGKIQTNEFNAARIAFESAPAAPWYERWIAGQRVEPQLKDYQAKEIADEFAFHPLLPDISQDVYNRLKIAADRFPQFSTTGKSTTSVLDLRPAVRREYPFGEVAAQTIGHVRAVSKEDREKDPNADDEHRRYALIDRIGREGLESLLEQRLRGSRGEKRTDRRGQALSVDEAKPGESVRTSIDIELCRAIQEAFKTIEFHNPKVNGVAPPNEILSMNGAAIVIDIKTGQVRALVSVPSYDLNRFDALYESLASDPFNRPLWNRALMDAMEPGSTVKPMVGIAAVTQKFLKATDTIECDGYAYVNGKRVERPRCWTMSMFNIAHHHTANGPHPTGFLTLSEAIQRSCNAYFVTEGARLGLDGLAYWFRKFGYGQPTRIGLPEARGVVPNMQRIEMGERASAAWYASIGQGQVLATPIQVANEFATIARDGIWVRPTLFTDQAQPPTTRPDGSVMEDRVDLQLDPSAVEAVKKGMFDVVNTKAGTGQQIAREDIQIAAKTGSATASALARIMRDEDGKAVIVDGETIKTPIPYGTHDKPNLQLPWYRATAYSPEGEPRGTHSWIAGFVPADQPQLAFAVYVEYGGSGGIGAGSVANKLIEQCIQLGYLQPTEKKAGADDASQSKPAPTGELLIGTEN